MNEPCDEIAATSREAEDNRAALARYGKLTIPALAVGGMVSNSGDLLDEVMHEVAEDVTTIRVPDTGHWIAEENLAAFASALLMFLDRSRA